MTRAKPRAKARRHRKSERKSAAASEAAALAEGADAVHTSGLALARPAAVLPDEAATQPSREAGDNGNSNSSEQDIHERADSGSEAAAARAAQEVSTAHRAATLLTPAAQTAATTAAPEGDETASSSSSGSATSETPTMAAEVTQLKAQLTAPFMLYDHSTHSIVPNPLYQRGSPLRRALTSAQSTLLHILREARAQSAQYTPKELLYHLQRAVLYVCAQALSLTPEMLAAPSAADGTSTHSAAAATPPSCELGSALDGLWCMSSDATVAGQLPALEAALARRHAPAAAVLLTSAALSEGSGHEELQRYVGFLQARLAEEQAPAMQSKRSAEERSALQATVNNVSDITQLQSALSVAYKSIIQQQQSQLTSAEQPTAAAPRHVTMSAEANARSVALLLQGYYNLLQWVLAVERDRAALRQSAGGDNADNEAAAAMPVLQSRVEEYDPYTGRLVLRRATPQSPWGLLTNMQGCLIGIENTLRNASPAGEQLYHVLQSAAPPAVTGATASSTALLPRAAQNKSGAAGDHGFPILQANRRRIRPPQLTQAELQAQQYDIVRRLCDSLAQPDTALHLVIQKRSQAELTAAHEVLFELAAQGAEQSTGQRVVLILQRALTSIPWGITLSYEAGSPALLTDFSSKLQLSDRAKNFLFDRRGQLRVLQVNYVDTRRLSSAGAMQELLAHSLLLALQLQVVAQPQRDSRGLAGTGAAAPTASSAAIATSAAAAATREAPPANTTTTTSSSAATTTTKSLDAAADAIMAEMLASRSAQGTASTATTTTSASAATTATQPVSLPSATHTPPSPPSSLPAQTTSEGAETAEEGGAAAALTAAAAEQAEKLSNARTSRAKATAAAAAAKAAGDDVAAHDASHEAVPEGHEWAAVPSSQSPATAAVPHEPLSAAAAAAAAAMAVMGGGIATSSGNEAVDTASEEDARHRELLEEYGITDSGDEAQRAQTHGNEERAAEAAAPTQAGQTDAVADVDTLTADVLADAEHGVTRMPDEAEAAPATRRKRGTTKADKTRDAEAAAMEEEGEGGTRAAEATGGKSTRRSSKKERAKKGKAKKKQKRERKSRAGKKAEGNSNDDDEAEQKAQGTAEEEAKDGVQADAATADTKAADVLQTGAEADKGVEAGDAAAGQQPQGERNAKQTRGKASRRAAGEASTQVALTQREFAGEVAALLHSMPADSEGKGSSNSSNNNTAADASQKADGGSGAGAGDALGATPLVPSKSTAEVALEVAANNGNDNSQKTGSGVAKKEASAAATRTLPEPSLVELVEAAPLTFDNAVQLTSFDGAQAHFHRTQTTQPWDLKLAFEHNDLYVTQLPPATAATARRHPFLRYLKPDAKGAGRWMVEQVNGTNVLEMTKEQKAPFVSMLRKATDVRFVLRALKR